MIIKSLLICTTEQDPNPAQLSKLFDEKTENRANFSGKLALGVTQSEILNNDTVSNWQRRTSNERAFLLYTSKELWQLANSQPNSVPYYVEIKNIKGTQVLNIKKPGILGKISKWLIRNLNIGMSNKYQIAQTKAQQVQKINQAQVAKLYKRQNKRGLSTEAAKKAAIALNTNQSFTDANSKNKTQANTTQSLYANLSTQEAIEKIATQTATYINLMPNNNQTNLNAKRIHPAILGNDKFLKQMLPILKNPKSQPIAELYGNLRSTLSEIYNSLPNNDPLKNFIYKDILFLGTKDKEMQTLKQQERLNKAKIQQTRAPTAKVSTNEKSAQPVTEEKRRMSDIRTNAYKKLQTQTKKINKAIIPEEFEESSAYAENSLTPFRKESESSVADILKSLDKNQEKDDTSNSKFVE